MHVTKRDSEQKSLIYAFPSGYKHCSAVATHIFAILLVRDIFSERHIGHVRSFLQETATDSNGLSDSREKKCDLIVTFGAAVRLNASENARVHAYADARVRRLHAYKKSSCVTHYQWMS